MRMYDLILKKKQGGELSTDEIRYMIEGFTEGSIPDYQMSAMTMAICFRGMTPRETVDLTLAMRDSGDVLDLSGIKGVKVDKHSTGGVGGAVLYLCLEDNFRRIQNRLYDMTDEPVDNLFFSVLADSIGNGLEEQIEFFKTEHSDLKIVFIDTLQMIRNSDEPSYSSDYKELTVLKNLADNLGISIVIVHHTRKSIDRDPFNMISGSTGLSGCVDGSMVLIETKRGSRKAVMHCVGRDIENCEISLVFDNDIKNRS